MWWKSWTKSLIDVLRTFASTSSRKPRFPPHTMHENSTKTTSTYSYPPLPKTCPKPASNDGKNDPLTTHNPPPTLQRSDTRFARIAALKSCWGAMGGWDQGAQGAALRGLGTTQQKRGATLEQEDFSWAKLRLAVLSMPAKHGSNHFNFSQDLVANKNISTSFYWRVIGGSSF